MGTASTFDSLDWWARGRGGPLDTAVQAPMPLQGMMLERSAMNTRLAAEELQRKEYAARIEALQRNAQTGGIGGGTPTRAQREAALSAAVGDDGFRGPRFRHNPKVAETVPSSLGPSGDDTMNFDLEETPELIDYRARLRQDMLDRQRRTADRTPAPSVVEGFNADVGNVVDAKRAAEALGPLEPEESWFSPSTWNNDERNAKRNAATEELNARASRMKAKLPAYEASNIPVGSARELLGIPDPAQDAAKPAGATGVVIGGQVYHLTPAEIEAFRAANNDRSAQERIMEAARRRST